MIADFGSEGFASCANDGIIILWKVMWINREYIYEYKDYREEKKYKYNYFYCRMGGKNGKREWS